MARRPKNFTWLGFTSEQVGQLDLRDFIGNNGWARNSQTEEVMPKLLQELADDEIALDRVQQAMADIGYGRHSLHELDRWESKRFGRAESL